MKSLQERVQEGMTEEERCDVLFSMVNRIEKGQKIGGSPEEVFLDGDNRIVEVNLGSPPNQAFCPPEMLQKESIRVKKAQRWFVLGMYAYYMYYQTDFYIRKNTAALVSRAGQPFVILPGDVSEIPFGEAVCGLTAVDPERREDGLKQFLAYLSKSMKEKAAIHYYLNGKCIGKQELILEKDNENLWPSGKVTIGKTAYQVLNGPVRIPYRPGSHTYQVQVALAGQAVYTPRTEEGLYLYCDAKLLNGYPSGQGLVQLLSTNVKNSNRVQTSQEKLRLDIYRLEKAGAAPVPSKYMVEVQRPKDYQGVSYWIDLSYDPQTKCVRLQLTSESGVAIAPVRSIGMASLLQ